MFKIKTNEMWIAKQYTWNIYYICITSDSCNWHKNKNWSIIQTKSNQTHLLIMIKGIKIDKFIVKKHRNNLNKNPHIIWHIEQIHKRETNKVKTWRNSWTTHLDSVIGSNFVKSRMMITDDRLLNKIRTSLQNTPYK